MIEVGVDTYYPTETTDGVTTFESMSDFGGCVNECSTLSVMMTGVTATDATIEFRDENNPYTISTSQEFSLQYSEGCCYYSAYDNSGEACADVYFIYKTDAPTTSPTTATPTIFAGSTLVSKGYNLFKNEKAGSSILDATYLSDNIEDSTTEGSTCSYASLEFTSSYSSYSEYAEAVKNII